MTVAVAAAAALVALLFVAWALGAELTRIDLQRQPCALAERLKAGAS